MNVEVNYLAVVLAVVSSIVVGSIWYAPPVFGNTWMKLVGLKKEKMGKNGWLPMVVTVLVSFLTAYVLAHVSYLSNYYFGNSFLQDALTTGFWLWLGLTAARLIMHDAFEGRPVKLTVLNVAHQFVTIMVMAAVIGFMGVA